MTPILKTKMDQFPLPSLQLYTVFSGLAVFYAVTYALTASTGFFYTLWDDIWCATVSEIILEQLTSFIVIIKQD